MIAEVLAKEKEKVYTLEEYFELEEKATQKSEFRNGKIIAMPEGTITHGIIIGNIFANLFINLADQYTVLNSEIAIYIPSHNHSVYADNCVVKGELEQHRNKNRAILNPIVIFEVASDSTEKYDRYGKFKKYQTLPSFQEYVLVEQDMPIVEVYLKNENSWQSTTYIGLEETVKLECIGAALKMTDIYKKVKGLLPPQMMLDV